MSPLKKQNNFEEKLREQLGGMEMKPSDALWSKIEQNMNADSFEPTLQKKLENYTVEPREEVWNQVESQLPESRRRNRWIWFSTLAVLLLATFSAGFWFRTYYSKESKDLSLSQVNSAINVPGAIEEPTNKISSNESLDANPSLVQAENKTENKPSINAEEPSLVQNRPATNNQENESLVQSDKQIEKLNTGKVNRNEKTDVNAGSLRQKGRTKSGIQNRGGLVNSSIVPPAVIPESKEQNPAGAGRNEAASPVTKGLENVNTSEKPTVPDAKNANQGSENKNAEPKIILESATISPNVKDTFAEDKLYRGSSYLAPEESFTNFSISAFAGAHISYMLLEMPTSNAYAHTEQAYDLRKKMESPSLDFAGGLLLNYHLGKSWFVSSGIGIIAFKQNVQFSVLPANQSNPPLVQNKNLYVNLNDSIIVGNANSYENRYSFTEIPLWIGYQFPSEKNVHFELMAGASFGKLSLVNAYMPDPGCIGILLANDKESFPKFKNVYFLNFAPSVSFKTNSSVEIGTSLVGKLALNSMIDNQQWIQQKPASIGINIFLRKRF